MSEVRKTQQSAPFALPAVEDFTKPFCFANSGLGCLGLYFVLGTREHVSISLLSAEDVA